MIYRFGTVEIGYLFLCIVRPHLIVKADAADKVMGFIEGKYPERFKHKGGK